MQLSVVISIEIDRQLSETSGDGVMKIKMCGRLAIFHWAKIIPKLPFLASSNYNEDIFENKNSSTKIQSYKNCKRRKNNNKIVILG